MKKFLLLSGLIFLSSFLLIAPASAANKEDFNAGRIIDDYVFYNSNSMNSSQIQSFLESKVQNCDYNGTQSASDWGYPNITHAQLAEYKRNGTNGFTQDSGFHAPPYKCLRVYTQDTPQMEAASGLCEGIPAYSNRSAAQIIKDISIACGINPQVLIVLLEKEQSLITDKWPLNRQLEKATGFACPDTAPCNPAFGGFFYQIYHAARQFKIYQAYPERYNYLAGRSQAIRWSPNSSCGSGQVYIENQATAGLYIYTPYQPNAAALNNLYGSGDGCSAYGNRNFWRIFSDWFGSTRSGQDRYRLISKATNTLNSGSQLKSGEFLTSPNGKYVLIMQPSGQLVMYKSKQPVWKSGSINWSQQGASLSFQEDGNLVLYKGDEALWSTLSSGSSAARVSLQNDGNLVLYTASNQVVWASDTSQPFTNLVLKGTSISTGDRLNTNSYLRSSDWRYFLVMQTDGNLVLYTAGYTQSIWNSETSGKGGKYISLQGDGNLVMYSDNGPVWASGTDGKSQVATLNLQADGNLVIRNTINQVSWASGTDGKGGKYISLQTDGNFVMRGDNGPVWASGTDGKSQSSVAFSCTGSNRINIGDKLDQGKSICSSNNLYSLVFQADGNLVLYSRKTSASWASHSDNTFFRSDLNL